MKRRTFIKLCSASVALAAIPVAIAQSPHFTTSNVEFIGQALVYDSRYGLALQCLIDGQKYRNAIVFDKPAKEMTEQDVTKGKTMLLDWANTQYLKTT